MILLNGPPGVGKSTLARRYVDDHPLALLLEIDAIRVSLGDWERLAESKLLARDLALAMGEAHLRSGHDVIVPQYLGRTEFIDALARLASTVRAAFHEIVLLATPAEVVDRFRARRIALASTGSGHPELEVTEPSMTVAIAEAFDRLEAVSTERPNTRVVRASGGTDEVYRMLGHELGETEWRG